ncbi:MAG: hypothetical protein JXR71_11645 [Bacteroidales bacterium]|nr:hypothetical protein [Bacteroidales bacterium]
MLAWTTSAAFSQVNYLPATLVNAKNDTLHGYINKYWEISPSYIRFKTDLQEKKGRLYRPTDSKSFRVDGVTYVSAIVSTLTDPRDFLNNLGYNASPSLKTDTTFLTVLVDGPKSLYYFNNDQNITSFYIKVDGKYQLLVFKKYFKTVTVNNSQTKSLTENKRYIGQLMTYLTNCPSIKSKIQTVGYKKNELISLFNKYYTCTQTKPAYAEKVKKAKYVFGFYAGANATRMKLRTNQVNSLTLSEFKMKPGIDIGATMDIILPVNYGKFVIHSELGYTAFQTTGSYSNYSDATDYQYIDTKLGAKMIALNSMMRFNFMTTPSSLFIDGGLSFNYFISTINYQKIRKMKFNQLNETVSEGKAITDLKNFNPGALVGIGYRSSRFSGELRYTFLPNITNSGSMQLSVFTFSFVATYYLK